MKKHIGLILVILYSNAAIAGGMPEPEPLPVSDPIVILQQLPVEIQKEKSNGFLKFLMIIILAAL
ncbi:MAG: hypothetical protein O3A45_03625 [Proteobacteria bacterium]|jgi:hypothetical protein|nr:hypothetical protein [Pseudomonadota bacterium]MDA1237964.1 hypothetical protein [Pseudomonadota bacterium]